MCGTSARQFVYLVGMGGAVAVVGGESLVLITGFICGSESRKGVAPVLTKQCPGVPALPCPRPVGPGTRQQVRGVGTERSEAGASVGVSISKQVNLVLAYCLAFRDFKCRHFHKWKN